MQNTSETWKSLAAADGTYVECRATINSTEYSDIEPPIVTRALMQNGLEIGNVVSAMCTFALDTTDTIPKSAEVLIETRLVGSINGEAANSEWLPQGTFYISKRVRDPITGMRQFECYDALLKTNAVWEPASSTWPQQSEDILDEILLVIGLTLDERTSIVSYLMNQPNPGTTMRDVLSIIAQHNGGNWIVTPNNKLRLVPIQDLNDAEEDVIEIESVIGEYYTGEIKEISGVRVVSESGDSLIGDETGAVISVGIPEIIAVDLAEELIGKTFRPFSYGDARYDIAAELGDYIQCEEAVSVIYSETVTLGATLHGDISAPDLAEIDDEYPYVGSSDKTLIAAKAYTKEYTDDAIDDYNDELTQLEIFNRLTDNGAAQGLVLYNGQLYMNATYMRSGTIDGDSVNAKKFIVVDENNNVIASFDSRITLGKSTNTNVELDYNSFEIKGQSGSVFLKLGDARDEQGRATVQDTYVGDGNNTNFLLHVTPTTINSVKVDDVTVSNWSLSNDIVVMTTAPAKGAVVVITYVTEQPVYNYTLGTRDPNDGIGIWSVAEGYYVGASGFASHAEGQATNAPGYISHAEGYYSTADGYAAHAEGYNTKASGSGSHAEGWETEASGTNSHTEGNSTEASGECGHAEGGDTVASGNYSHAEGRGTIASGTAQHAVGRYNVSDDLKLEIVGNGTNDSNRSNARTLDENGNEWIAGALSVGNAATTRTNLGITPANIGAFSTGDVIPPANGGVSQAVTISDWDDFYISADNAAKYWQYGRSFSGSASNAPISGNNITYNGWVMGSSNYCIQCVYVVYADTAANRGRQFVRCRVNGVWQSWIEVTTANSVIPVDKGGTGATTPVQARGALSVAQRIQMYNANYSSWSDVYTALAALDTYTTVPVYIDSNVSTLVTDGKLAGKILLGTVVDFNNAFRLSVRDLTGDTIYNITITGASATGRTTTVYKFDGTAL